MGDDGSVARPPAGRVSRRILVWHVHGSWMTALVQGPHQYLVPVLPDRGPDGRGRAETWDWPSSVTEVSPEEAAEEDVDLVILQRPVEYESLVARWLGGRVPGRHVPAVYVEHNAPQGAIAAMRHPAADHPELTVVHVTAFNALFWDTGATPSRVIEHGVVDPGYRYEGALARVAVTINEPLRRGRVTGTDLVQNLSSRLPVDLFGIGTEAMGGVGNLSQERLHDALSLRRVYFHPFRWTSLGLSLIESMHLGMPVVALATTEVPEAVPPGAGIVSNRPEVLEAGLRALLCDPEEARIKGKVAREAALARYGLDRFLNDWDRLIEDVCR